MAIVVKQSETFFPILQAIFEINPDGPVPYQEIVARALKNMGLTLDCMGEKDGRALVYTPFSNGGNGLRWKGCIVSEGRAWKLTDVGKIALKTKILPKDMSKEEYAKLQAKGVTGGGPRTKTKAPKTEETETEKTAPDSEETEVAPDSEETEVDPVFAPVEAAKSPEPKQAPASPQEPAGAAPAPTQATPPPPPPPKPETAEEAAERLLSETPTKNGGKGKAKLAIVATPLPDAPEWTKDGYLRALVASNTPCYGAYSPKVEACGKCPLRVHCQVSQATALSVLAGVLKDEAEKKSRLTATEVSSAHGVVAAALTHDRPRTDAGKTVGKKMTASFDGVCARSGETISKGDAVYYVPGEGLVSERAFTAG